MQTVEELEKLIADPEEMNMQALLVRERILGPAHPDTSYYIRYRGAVFADNGKFDNCIVLWMYALDMNISNLDALSPTTLSNMLSFGELFHVMKELEKTRSTCLIKFSDICSIFTKAVCELDRGRRVLMDTQTEPGDNENSQNYSKLMKIIMHLMSLTCCMASGLTKEEQDQGKEIVLKLISIDPRNSSGQTLLHLAANRETTDVGRYPVCTFPCAYCIELLTQLDVSLDIRDLHGNTALDVARQQKPPAPDHIISMLTAGTRKRSVNDEKKEALEYAIRRSN